MIATPASQTCSFHLSAPRARVFPLFTPLGERAWAAGWDPQMLSGERDRGTAFATRGQDGRQTHWIVTEYCPEQGRASYARLAHDSNIGLVDIVCTDGTTGGTQVSVRYTLTGITEQGRAFVAEFLRAETFARMIEGWRTAIEAALANA